MLWGLLNPLTTINWSVAVSTGDGQGLRKQTARLRLDLPRIRLFMTSLMKLKFTWNTLRYGLPAAWTHSASRMQSDFKVSNSVVRNFNLWH